jgi:hydroxymethylglutaryl-CoA lyase
MKLPPRVQLIDVGPRDGLQNEKQLIATEVKIELVHKLQAAGLREIEVTSYVSPKWMPQMGDNAQVMAGVQRKSGVRYSVLTPNLKGFEAAVADSSIAESIERFAPVVRAAKNQGIAVRGAMSCTVGCPYEGEIAPEKVAYLAGLMRGIGVERVDVADTIGVGTPHAVQRAIEATLAHFDLDHVSGHFHDTYGQALSNTLAALEIGVWNFQSSVAGLGGCPYAKGATGNVATEDLVYMLHGLNIETGVDLDLLVDAGKFISDQLGRKPNSRAATALLNKRVGSS